MQKVFLRNTLYKLHVLAPVIVVVMLMLGGYLEGRGQQSQFSYGCKTEVVYNHEKGFPLPLAIEQFALTQNKHLNSSIFFDTSFIVNTKQVRAHHTKDKPDKRQVGQLIDFVTEDGALVSCTYFDRGSDKLVVVGEGFTNDREKMTPFVDMFDCDVVLFDLRGQGYREFDIVDPETWPLDLAQLTFGMDAGIASMGQHEEKDVFAVIDGLKKRKNYKEINGISVCYSSFILLKAEALRPGTFNKIVVDGCWLSLDLVIKKLKKDVKMLWNPQAGGWSKTWPCSEEWFQEMLEFLARNIWHIQLNGLSVADYVSLIKNTPVLFFYGKDDLMVSRSEFEQIWRALATKQKTAIVTSNPHVRNHLKQKELYKLICDLFFELDQQQFVECLQDINALVNYHISKYSRFIDATKDSSVA